MLNGLDTLFGRCLSAPSQVLCKVIYKNANYPPQWLNCVNKGGGCSCGGVLVWVV